MKIQCNVCETAEAKVLCCADEAALCWGCDDKVHAANKLASKHQRVPLSGSSPQMPKCDICQETAGFFFCLEDRALLCRKCDVAIHTANAFVSTHQRFLLTGVKVGLESTDPGASSSSASETRSNSVSIREAPMPLPLPLPNQSLSAHLAGVEDFANARFSFSGGGTPQWHLDDFLGMTDFNQTYGYLDNGSSKADTGKRGESDSSAILRCGDEELNDEEECLGEVPDSGWAVPQIPSPPTASGLYWPKRTRTQTDSSNFVPDICCSNPTIHGHGHGHGHGLHHCAIKRRQASNIHT
ncbi:B-box zinc finger protein 22 [Euphorbia lathyris]|uniref:B-box zinc finger protein 22 n=1 Tax=Euphorbia lathyris TaxID=212925 RepID=UPI003314164C